jgi:uncharacterized protein YceK
MRRAALLIVICTAVVGGCATVLAHGDRPDPYSRLEAGVQALDAREYARARSLLEPLYLEFWSEPLGQRAMLALISIDLDSRNANRSLWAAAEGAARLLNVPEPEPWIVPVAETYYLLAIELGAQEERLAEADLAVAQAEARAQRAESGRFLPQSARETVPMRISRLETEKSALQRRVTQLEEQLGESSVALRETRQELERIKRTIKP